MEETKRPAPREGRINAYRAAFMVEPRARPPQRRRWVPGAARAPLALTFLSPVS